ncbi:MAG: 1-acyl-sn-glycerol-3-phosphate acyltransferase [Acidobacteria bacterium]|nr:1-acyl-sn-glycerol-3-phosphate acyltransferase [Acidobacteriota bacterium]
MKYIRAAFRMTAFFTATIAIYCGWFIGDLIIPNKAYWRQLAFRNGSRFFVKLSRMEIEILGEVPSQPFFLVSNHLGYVDIPVLRAIIESVFVAKRDIEGWFLAGKIVGDMGNIYIDRENRRDIPVAGAKIIDTLDRGEGVIIFPEGTSSKGEEVLPFNSSFFEFAAKIDLPIHYASITYRVENAEMKASDAICWWDDSTFIEHLWRFFQLRDSKAIVSFGIETVVKANRKELAQELWDRVSEKFIPVV